MKRFVRFVCIVLVIALTVPTVAYATEENSSRASAFFKSSCTYLYKVSDTKFQVWFSVTALDIMDELGASSVKVQRSLDGENWTTMFTYLPEYYSQMICTNTGGHTGYVPYTGTVGYYYRAIVVYYAKNGANTGKVTEYTSKLKL